MEFHTVEGSRQETLQSFVSGTVSSRISHFMCKGGSIGFLSKINAEIRIQLETTIHCINVHLKQHAIFPVKKSVREKMLQSIISTSVNLERTAVLEWWPLNECFMRKEKLLEWQGIFQKIRKYSWSWQQEGHHRFN